MSGSDTRLGEGETSLKVTFPYPKDVINPLSEERVYKSKYSRYVFIYIFVEVNSFANYLHFVG